jgi:hypothetical protein
MMPSTDIEDEFDAAAEKAGLEFVDPSLGATYYGYVCKGNKPLGELWYHTGRGQGDCFDVRANNGEGKVFDTLEKAMNYFAKLAMPKPRKATKTKSPKAKPKKKVERVMGRVHNAPDWLRHAKKKK